jgi:hypothetical protein
MDILKNLSVANSTGQQKLEQFVCVFFLKQGRRIWVGYVNFLRIHGLLAVVI